ncbi:AraC family transcriptional regulator [Clostridium sp. 'White wine YQ']|uniref:AraC family transcriptional regulator n=1 Tax=Clostridium sp. 'White wine YQ' TaxID=3027474 RepID=UPI002365584D|nr:AraC family transcriptional regulator [Clostridium sp. 'White wine YQ']MDD7795470.1 AraC family transcriptional regulator [Clostridium sp. 'White wine YQ']
MNSLSSPNFDYPKMKIDYDINIEFPIKIRCHEHTEPGPIVESHFHDHFMLCYIVNGECIVHCNTKHIAANKDDLIVINNNDAHYIECLCTNLVYYIIKIDFAFLLGNQKDLDKTDYIEALIKNNVRFSNEISKNKELLSEINILVNESQNKNLGYELIVKSSIFRIIVMLLRNNLESISISTNNRKNLYSMNSLKEVLEYIDSHYNEKITLTKLATMSNLSKHHFCRLFKRFTGKTFTDYINLLRINKAVSLLKDKDLNINEVALSVGFNDSNYFSRIFKRYKNISPNKIRNK